MARVSPLLSSAPQYAPGQLSLFAINGWINDLYSIPYAHCSRWATPAEVHWGTYADCKGKAIMLYANMRRYGATNVRLVIGKRRIEDLKTHAWVEWDTTAGKYLLDPTFNALVPQTGWTDSTTYIPFYAYDAGHKYRADNHRSRYPTTVAQNIVATGYAVSRQPTTSEPASWTTTRSFDQSGDYARAQASLRPRARTSGTISRRHHRKTALAHRRRSHHRTNSPAASTANLSEWGRDSAPYPNWQ